MGDFPSDVARFIEQKFDTEDVPSVQALLDHPELTTPRVVRSLLYLSNGSVSMLRHYIGECLESVTTVLVAAEFVTGHSTEPMPARDMSLPFPHRRNLGRNCFHSDPGHRRTDNSNGGFVLPPRRSPRRQPSTQQEYLAGERFYLGEVMYVVARGCASGEAINCYRVDGTNMTPVRLPLMFVLERLAEHIELQVSI